MAPVRTKASAKAGMTIFLATFFGTPALGLINGLVTMMYWNWFARYVWISAPVISYPAAIGLVILISLLLGKRFFPLKLPTMNDVPDEWSSGVRAKEEDWKYRELGDRVASSLREWIRTNIWFAAALLLFGWILHHFA